MSDPLIAELRIGDIHDGHRTAIMYPKNYRRYTPNKAQKWLYKVFTKNFLVDVQELLDEFKPDYVHGNIGGDCGDLNYHNRSEQYWAETEWEVIDNLKLLLRPFVELCDTVHFLKGTKSHVGKSHQLDEAIAREFSETVWNNDYASWTEVNAVLAGVLVNSRHYGKNQSKWGKGNLINSLRDEIILDCIKHGRRVPDIAYRHHFHWAGMTVHNEKPMVVQVPSWQLPYDHIAQIDPVGRTPVVGGVVSFYQGKTILGVHQLNYTWKEKSWSPTL